MADLVVCPYVPLTAETSVGEWTLLPFRSVEGSASLPGDVARPVLRLVAAYRVDGQMPMGAVAFPRGERIGAAFERASLDTLRRSLLAGLISGNPRMAVPEEEQDANGGHSVRTSENAQVWGHPLGDGDSYVLSTGVLARTLGLHHADPDEPLPPISPPAELPRPWSGLDEEFADATHELLLREDATSRRLGRALDWYEIALSNATAVSLAVRVGAARTAFELLTDVGETRRLVRAYGVLTRTDETADATYEDVYWADGPVQLTPEEWWMTRLCSLRNAIVHGDDVPEELWLHDGLHQLNHIHDRLIEALRLVVAESAADALLRLAPRDRIFPRIARQTRRHLAGPDDGGDPW